MLDRKLLSEALRIENKDVLPKFGTTNLFEHMKENTEYIDIHEIVDLDGHVTEDGIYKLIDLLGFGSVGISEDGQPSMVFRRVGDEIEAHFHYDDTDAYLDNTKEALVEYIQDYTLFPVDEGAAEDFALDNAESLKNAFFSRMNSLKEKSYWKDLDVQDMRKDQEDYAEIILVNDVVDDWCAAHEVLSNGEEGKALRAYLKDNFKSFLLQWQGTSESISEGYDEDFRGIGDDELYSFISAMVPELELDLQDSNDIAFLASRISDEYSVSCDPREFQIYLEEKGLVPAEDPVNEDFSIDDALVLLDDEVKSAK